MSLYRDHVIDLNGTTLLGKVSNDLSRGIQTSRPLADGSVTPTHQAITAADPVHTITTLDLDVAITACGTLGGLIDGTITWYDALIDSTGGAKASGSVHTAGSYSKAYMVPSSLQVGARSVAQMSYEMHGIGTNDPVTISEDQALSGTDGADKQYGLGSLLINGTEYSQIVDFNISFNVSPTRDTGDGDIGSRDIITQSGVPTITFTTTDLETLQAAIDGGLALNGTTGFVVYLRQRSENGSYYLSGANHIKIEVLDGLVLPEGTSGNQSKSASFRVEPKYGSQNPIVITTGATLPA